MDSPFRLIQRLIGKVLFELRPSSFSSRYLASGLYVNHQPGSRFDYRWSGGITLANKLHEQPQPWIQQVSERVDHLRQTDAEFAGLTDEIELSPKGFLNLRLADRYLHDAIQASATSHVGDLSRPTLAPVPAADRRRVLIDFASPNYAKELHVGHFRSIVQGECLSRILEALGHDVLRLSHVGDFGTPIGLVIAHLAETLPADASAAQVLSASMSDIYLAAKLRASKDPAFADLAHQFCHILQLQLTHLPPTVESHHDISSSSSTFSSLVSNLQFPENARHALSLRSPAWIFQTWRDICLVSRRSFDEIAAKLDVRVQERGESFYASRIPAVMGDLVSQGLVQPSQGALVAFLDDAAVNSPMLVQKSDGAYLYSTTDLACFRQRVQEEQRDWLVYVTDASQRPHFKAVFELCRRAGYYDPQRVRVDHVGFGVVRSGADQKKISSRDGTAKDKLLHGLIDDAVRAAAERSPAELSAEAVFSLGASALRYFDLSHQNWKDYTFDPERMFSWKGNTSSYIMYAFTRASSIIRNFEAAGSGAADLDGAQSALFTAPSERALAFKLVTLRDSLHAVEYDLSPHHLCEHLYDIATLFHAFYENCPVIEADSSQVRSTRLFLCYATRNILKDGLYLLGINRPTDKM